MKFMYLEQDSAEWHDFRKYHIGASDCPAIMGISPFRTAMSVYEEKVLNRKFPTSNAMTRGKALEPIARRKYNEMNSHSNFGPAVATHELFTWMSASFDGIDINTKQILEIKCPGPDTHNKIKNGNIPEYMMYQVMHQLIVSGYDQGILISYYDGEIIDVLIGRDEPLIKKIIAAESEFYEKSIRLGEPPEIVDARYPEIVSSETSLLLKEYFKTVQLRKELEELEKIQKQALMLGNNGESYICDGVKVVKYYTPGRVDYAKVPALKGVDLSPFRRPPSECWRVTAPKALEEESRGD